METTLQTIQVIHSPWSAASFYGKLIFLSIVGLSVSSASLNNAFRQTFFRKKDVLAEL